ncbi:MAG TPA: hypothetical protein VGG79_00035 [Roseiarcus sp.]
MNEPAQCHDDLRAVSALGYGNTAAYKFAGIDTAYERMGSVRQKQKRRVMGNAM